MERKKLECILCPVDFSEFSVRAYDYASSLSQHYGAKLLLFHAVEMWQHPSACFATTAKLYEEFCQHLLTTGREELQKFAEKHSPRAVHPECLTCEGMARESILSLAKERAVNLIVMGTHGVRGFDRLMLGSVTERVLRKAPCPVLAVHAPGQSAVRRAAGEPMELREILFCTDFSDDANSALDYALSVASEYEAHLTLVHVLDGLTRLHRADDAAYGRLDALIPEKWRNRGGIGSAVRSGTAYREISQVAREKQADLVIMAAHGSGSTGSAVFGSTTYRVVQLGNCPVLAVPC
jgi:nucleotide-binding universal stress UspA family protein